MKAVVMFKSTFVQALLLSNWQVYIGHCRNVQANQGRPDLNLVNCT